MGSGFRVAFVRSGTSVRLSRSELLLDDFGYVCVYLCPV